MMRPLRARSMPWAARLATRYAAVRLASTTDAKSSSLMRSSSPSLVMPAFDTSTWTGPWASSAALNAASTSAADVTSHFTASTPSGGGELR